MYYYFMNYCILASRTPTQVSDEKHQLMFLCILLAFPVIHYPHACSYEANAFLAIAPMHHIFHYLSSQIFSKNTTKSLQQIIQYLKV